MGSSKQRIHKRRGVRRLNLQGGAIGSNGVVSIDTSIKASNEPINSPVNIPRFSLEKELQNSRLRNTDNLSLAINYFDWIDTLTDLARLETLKANPNNVIIRHLVEISSHLAMGNCLHKNHEKDKAEYGAIYG